MFGPLLSKEWREQWRTSKTIIFGLVFLVTGIISPVLAKYTPALLRTIPDVPEGLAALIPEPTVVDAVGQYIKNASQFGVLLVVLLTMGSVAQEKERGTAAMLLTKPIQRSALILAKWAAGMATLILGVGVSAAACLVYTALFFELLPIVAFLALNGLLIVFFGVYLSVSILASTLARTQAMAAGGAFGGVVFLLVFGALPRLGDYLPSGLLTWGSALLVGGDKTAWPALAVSLGIMALSLGLACLHFERQEI